MGEVQDRRRKPGKGREEQEPPTGPSQDPVHPESYRRESGAAPEREHRREEDLRDWDVRDEDF